jgi:hypothetical protein
MFTHPSPAAHTDPATPPKSASQMGDNPANRRLAKRMMARRNLLYRITPDRHAPRQPTQMPLEFT